MPKVPKISAYLCSIPMAYETDFLPADKQKDFLQILSITLGVHG